MKFDISECHTVWLIHLRKVIGSNLTSFDQNWHPRAINWDSKAFLNYIRNKISKITLYLWIKLLTLPKTQIFHGYELAVKFGSKLKISRSRCVFIIATGPFRKSITLRGVFIFICKSGSMNGPDRSADLSGYLDRAQRYRWAKNKICCVLGALCLTPKRRCFPQTRISLGFK